MAAPRGDYNSEQDRRVRGTEVFVGGLPRSATEGTLREVFSTCGEIVDVRIMKDQNGISKGYGFVRFSKREYANTAKRKKNGFQLQGKKLDVDLSLDQDTLFFGNLHKGCYGEDFHEELVWPVIPCLLNCVKEVQGMVPMDAKEMPALHAKVTLEE